MKTIKVILLILATLVMFSCVSTTKVDLPEEISEISKDNKHPDALTGYLQNDTIHIGFANNRMRDYQLDVCNDECYIYDGNRLVGKCKMDSNLIEQLIDIDNQ